MTQLDQDELLVRFRKELLDKGALHEGDTIGEDDETLLRFLRARKFDLPQAEKMFLDAQTWRKTVGGIGIDEMYKNTDPFDYPERDVVFQAWSIWYHKVPSTFKTDKKGRPIIVESYGGMNMNKLYEVCTPERHWETCLVNSECLTRECIPAASRAAGKPIGTSLVIFDLKGLGLSAFWQMKTLVRNASQVSQDYYPETLGQLAIINAPATFAMIWGIVKPWLSKETAEKVDILGSDYKNVLLGLVDVKNLPASLGGECTCSDMGGCHLSGAGPWLENRTGWGPKSQGRNINEDVDGKSGSDGDTPSQVEQHQ